MGNGVVYYFSGTGNSLWVATRLAEQLGMTVVPMASATGSDAAVASADAIGLVFPVYYAGLPNLVRRFVERVDPPPEGYTFAVATYGGAAGGSLRTVDDILRSRGEWLTAGFGVHMPQNAFHKPWEQSRRVVTRALKRITTIERSVASRWVGISYSNSPIQRLTAPLTGLLRRATARQLEKLSQLSSPSGLDLEELIPTTDRSFTVDERCNGCGTCARVCPVNNIEIVDGSPEWHHRCETCLACYAWCPQAAIAGGIVASGHRYRHPDVSAEQIAEQRLGVTDRATPAWCLAERFELRYCGPPAGARPLFPVGRFAVCCPENPEEDATMKTLVIYYSKTGNTKAVAERIAQALDADLEEILEVERRTGNLRSAMDAILGKRPALQPMSRSPADYDLVFLGTPVWKLSPAPAMQVFLSNARLESKPVGLFCTMGGMGDKRTFASMERSLAGSRAIGRLSLDGPQMKDPQEVTARVTLWLDELRPSFPAPEAPTS